MNDYKTVEDGGTLDGFLAASPRVAKFFSGNPTFTEADKERMDKRSNEIMKDFISQPMPSGCEVIREDLNGWRDFESAPKDGQLIDVWAGGRRITDVCWDGDHKEWVKRTYQGEVLVYYFINAPTHWRFPPPSPVTT